MRAICADWSLNEYFRGIRMTISPRYGPEDVHVGNWAGALEALNAGVTTILDFSHCMNTPDHADEAVRGLRDAGVRGVMAYGYYPSPVPEPRFAEHAQRLADARRVRERHFSASHDLLSMGIALTEVGLLPWEQTRAEVESARELDALLTAHTGCVWGSQLTLGIRELDAHGLLGSDQVHVHCNTCSGEELDLLAQAGAKVSSTPETELQMGMGRPILRAALARGMAPTLGCDIISNNSGDLFAQMRIGLAAQRQFDNEPSLAQDTAVESLSLTVRDALGFVTVNGAAALGLGDRVGSLTPGKQADVVVLRPTGFALWPVNDPVAAVVLQASAADVDTVLVAGRIVKRNGALVGVEPAAVRGALEASRDRVLGAVRAAGPVLPEAPEGFAEALAAMAEANLAPARA